MCSVEGAAVTAKHYFQIRRRPSELLLPWLLLALLLLLLLCLSLLWLALSLLLLLLLLRLRYAC